MPRDKKHTEPSKLGSLHFFSGMQRTNCRKKKEGRKPRAQTVVLFTITVWEIFIKQSVKFQLLLIPAHSVQRNVR